MGLDIYMEKRHKGRKPDNVLYLRKANQIHRYFVEKFANGVDECQEIPVTIKDIQELRDLCQEVLDKCKLEKGWVRSGGAWITLEKDKKVAVFERDGLEAKSRGHKKAQELVVGDLIQTDTPGVNESTEWLLEVAETVGNADEIRLNGQYTKVGEVVTNSDFAKEKLPTQAGFFFGDTDYTEYYLGDLESYIVQADKIIKDYTQEVAEGANPEEIEFVYQASW